MHEQERIADIAYGYLISGERWVEWKFVSESDRKKALEVVDKLAKHIKPPVTMWHPPKRLGSWWERGKGARV